MSSGVLDLTWDGRDEGGQMVPDEAWSLRLDFQSSRGTWTYFPASAPAAMRSITPDFFDRNNGVLRYTLPTASRVHLQAGIADRTTADRTAGAILKTIVNRAPRPIGAVIEQWTGMDESGTIYVPALQNFVVSIAATPLPENSVMTYGNRKRDFLSMALHRNGVPLLHHHGARMHHEGLTALDDVAPRMSAQPRNAIWRAENKTWVTSARRVVLDIGLSGETAERFKSQPARMTVYIDQKKVVDALPSTEKTVTITLPSNTAEHIVAVNWTSDYGPVAATAFRIHAR